MKLEQLKQLIVIDEQKSISKAAKTLYIGQSTLSSSLTALEEELGVRLFERDFTGVTITDEGREVIQQAKIVLDAISYIQNVGRKDKELYGTASVTIGQGYGFLAPELLRAFHEKHPKAELDLHVETPDTLTAKLLSGENKFVLGAFPPMTLEYLLEKKPDLHYDVFGECKFQVYVGKNHRLSSKSAVNWTELKEERFVTNSKQLRSVLWNLLGAGREILAISDKDVLNQLISMGNMVAFLPELYTENNKYYEHGEIVALDMVDTPLFVSVSMALVYPDEHTLTLLEQSTLQIMRDVLNQI